MTSSFSLRASCRLAVSWVMMPSLCFSAASKSCSFNGHTATGREARGEAVSHKGIFWVTMVSKRGTEKNNDPGAVDQ